MGIRNYSPTPPNKTACPGGREKGCLYLHMNSSLLIVDLMLLAEDGGDIGSCTRARLTGAPWEHWHSPVRYSGESVRAGSDPEANVVLN